MAYWVSCQLWLLHPEAARWLNEVKTITHRKSWIAFPIPAVDLFSRAHRRHLGNRSTYGTDVALCLSYCILYNITEGARTFWKNNFKNKKRLNIIRMNKFLKKGKSHTGKINISKYNIHNYPSKLPEQSWDPVHQQFSNKNGLDSAIKKRTKTQYDSQSTK